MTFTFGSSLNIHIYPPTPVFVFKLQKERLLTINLNSQPIHFARFVPYCTEDTENYTQNSQMPITID